MTESSQPALHPERIRAAIKLLRNLMYGAVGSTGQVPESQAYESAIAALELVRKGQLAVGLTGDVADAGQAALKLLATIQRLGK